MDVHLHFRISLLTAISILHTLVYFPSSYYVGMHTYLLVGVYTRNQTVRITRKSSILTSYLAVELAEPHEEFASSEEYTSSEHRSPKNLSHSRASTTMFSLSIVYILYLQVTECNCWRINCGLQLDIFLLFFFKQR
jgi:hypothetical protein